MTPTGAATGTGEPAPVDGVSSGGPQLIEETLTEANGGVIEPPAPAWPDAVPYTGDLTTDAPDVAADGEPAMDPPSVPLNHRVYPKAGGFLQVWSPAASDGGSAVTYLAEMSPNANFSTPITLVDGTNNNSVDWSTPIALAPGSVRHIRVRGINADGQGPYACASPSGTCPGSAVTVPVTASLPGAPTGMAATPLPGGARISWTPPAVNGGSPITGYVVIVRSDQGKILRVTDLGPGVTTTVLDGFEPWIDRFVVVAARNANGIGTLSASTYFQSTDELAPECFGTGADGKRIEVLFAHATGTTPTAEQLDAADGYTARIEKMFVDSAAKTGGVRHVRWRTNTGTAGCRVPMTTVEVDPATANFSAMRTSLVGQGFNQANRKYLTWVDRTTVTGFNNLCTAQWLRDEQSGAANLSNTTTMHAICPLELGIGFGPGHEVMHNLGAVQDDAPNSDNASHCNQGYDPLCYGPAMVVDPACNNQFVDSYLFDCKNDDYFHTNPAPGSYLCTNWNTARSEFLTNHLDDSVPSEPLLVEATAGNTQASLVWTVPVQQSCPGVSAYEITASPVPPGGAVKTTVGAGTSFVFTGLTNGVAYTFTVNAKSGSAAGPPSLPSNTVTPNSGGVTVPGAPTGVSAVPGALKATVSWTAPASNGGAPITGYRVTASPGGAVVTVGNVTSAVVPGLTDGQAYTFTVRAQNSSGFGAPSAASTAVTPTSQRTFHGLAPVRVLDSRPPPESVGPYTTPWGPGVTRDLVVAGANGVPADASAVVMNVTAVNPSAASFLTVWPAGNAKPTASNLNFGPGDVIPNLVVVKVGVDGAVSFFNNSGNVNVLADIVGYFDQGGGSGARFTGTTPTRLLDSRPPPENVGTPPTPWSQGQTRDLQVAGAAGVPGNATEVVVNVTVTGASAASFLTVFPTGETKPLSSNLNFKAGQTIPNLVVAKLGTGGKISIFNNSGSVNVIGDVVGYFAPTGAAFTPVVPVRIIDSRPGPDNIGPYSTKWVVGGDRQVAIGGFSPSPVPVDATAVVLNVTAVNPQLDSFLTLYPALAGPNDTSNRPLSSNLNFPPGKVIPNLVMVPLGVDGKIRIYNNSGTVDVLVDVVGYYR